MAKIASGLYSPQLSRLLSFREPESSAAVAGQVFFPLRRGPSSRSMTDSNEEEETNEERKEGQTQYGGTNNPDGAENVEDEDDEE